MLTQARLRELLVYDLDTGIWRWRVSRGSKANGGVAGTSDNKGYIRIKIEGKKYRAHRLAFLYVLGVFPKEVDHCNRCKNDNAWSNLRLADSSQNNINKPLLRNNTSGYKGVSFLKSRGTWRAILNRKLIGTFHTPEEAAVAYTAAVKAVYPGFYM